MSKLAALVLICLPFGFVNQAYATDLTVKNYSQYDLDVYYMALGCIHWPDNDLWTVCKKETLKPGAEAKYSFPWGTSAKEILMRPTDMTKMINNNWDMDPGWGGFAKTWVSAFKDLATKGPKGLLSYLNVFKKLWDIKKKLDITHSLAKWNANIANNQVFEFGQYDSDLILNRFKKMAAETKK